MVLHANQGSNLGGGENGGKVFGEGPVKGHCHQVALYIPTGIVTRSHFPFLATIQEC